MNQEDIKVGYRFSIEEIERLLPDFSYFFDEDNKGIYLFREPTPEFLARLNEELQIQEMAKIQDMDEFEKKVAEHVAKNLSVEDKKTILGDPEYERYNFGLGMYIRNNYIYGRNIQANFGMPIFADSITEDVFHELVKILQNERS